MAFSRHNIEKRRLIELVRLNPILWDCRLPHYKRSDKKKAIKWNELGRLFNVNGERVQRTFTSLREIFRRELNHEKMLGIRFKSKWEYYDAMAFLKEVIRERKSRERVKVNELSVGNLNNSSSCIDEYQFFAPGDPNNPNNQMTPSQAQPPSQLHNLQQPQHQQPSSTHLFNTLQKGSNPPARTVTPMQLSAPPPVAPLPPQLQQLQQQAQHLQALQLQPDVTLSLQKLSTQSPQTQQSHQHATQHQHQHQHQQQEQQQKQKQQQQHQQLVQSSLTIAAAAQNSNTITTQQQSPTHVLSSSRSSSSSPSIYIKDEPDSNEEETISLATTQNGKITHERRDTCKKLTTTDKAQQKQQQQQEHQLFSKLSFNVPPNMGNIDFDDDDNDVDDDDDFDDISPVDADMLNDRGSVVSSLTASPFAARADFNAGSHQPNAREMLNTKFGDFLTARLNTLHETVANELMNKILLLIAEK